MDIRKLLVQFRMLIILILMIIVLSFISPRFLTRENLSNVLWSISIIGIMVSGTIYSPITAGVDLSIGSLAALTGIILVKFMQGMGMAVFPSILLTVLIGSLIGWIHGIIITRFRVPPFIITMAAKTYLFGLAMFISAGKMLPIMGPPRFLALGFNKIFGFPVPIFIMALLIIASHIVLKKSVYGRQALAVGANPETARLSGINPDRVQTIAYVLSGFTASIAGIVLSSISQMSYALNAQGKELEVITAIVLGGTSLGGGGKGSVVGGLIGTIMVGLITNGLNLMNVPASFHPIVTGIVIIAALALNTNGIPAIKLKKS